jgi:di/tricarboxylate transporter
VEATPKTVEKIMKIRDNLGPLSRREIVVVIIFTLALLFWITEDVNPLNAGVISLLLSLMIFLPQAKVMEIGKFSSSIPWGSILLFAASLFLARSVSRYQALDPVATNIFNMLGLERLTPMFFIGSLVFVAMILHVIFTSTTVYATVMVPIVISLTQLQGISPALIALPIAFLASVALLLPVNTIPNIVFFSEGWFNERQMALYGSLLSFASVAIVLLIGVPYWRFIGII